MGGYNTYVVALYITLTLQLSERIAMSDAAQLWRKGDYVTLGAHVAYQGLTVTPNPMPSPKPNPEPKPKPNPEPNSNPQP